MPPSGAPFLIGKLGSYDVATVDKIDTHLRRLRLRLTRVITPRERGRLWHDVDELLDVRAAKTPKVPTR